MVAMQCVFCVFWQDNDINSSDAVRVLCVAIQCAFRVFLQYSDISCSESVRVFYGRTAISTVAIQCVFLWQLKAINGSDGVRVLPVSM